MMTNDWDAQGATSDSSALPDLFAEPFYCARCHDSGFEEGKGGVFHYCACRPVREARSRLKRLGLFGAARRMSFDSFRADAPWQRDIKRLAQDFAAREQPGWLFFGGQSGCGKTHLCTAAAVVLLRRGFPLQYMRWMSESARLKTLALDGARMNLLQTYIDAPLLYVDDLFKGAPSEADRHIAFELLDARCSDHSRITILSSERTLDDILQIDEAIGGRIMERCGDDVVNIRRDPARNFRLRA